MEQRNMLLAFALSMVVLLGWQALFPAPEGATQPQAEASQSRAAVVDGSGVKPPTTSDLTPLSAGDGSASAAAGQKVAADAGSDGVVIARLHNSLLTIGINSRGSLIDATLTKYRDSLKDGGQQVRVLQLSTQRAQYLNSGIMGESGPIAFHLTTSSSDRIVLEAKLGGGRVWQRTLRLKPDSYALEIEDRIRGGAGSRLYLQAVERYPDKTLNTFYEHAGPIGLLNGKLQEPDYDDLDEKPVRSAGIGGWTGIMSRYFLTAIYGDQNGDYRYFYKGDGRAYQAGIILDGVTDGHDALFHSSVFIGPKSIALLKTFGVGLERSVDFGLFAFIAKPMHSFMVWLFDLVHNFGLCIILLVVLIKIIFYWPSQKSYASMAAMRKIQPEMKRMQERYSDDRQRLGEEMMKLYKKHKVNPLSGCLPILIQIPVFFALYKVLLMSIEMRQAPFFGWITDLSVNDPWFILPVLMGASMFIQMRLNPQPPDPMQAKVMQFLPIIFTVMFLFFPAGLVLYWLVNNVLSIAQQRLVMKQLGVD
ncbi:MAG: membrane protein insertase YidC [Mariprofundales bacterium]|nr:membrane protein insertase YidC [Mariprofundales bacterium]